MNVDQGNHERDEYSPWQWGILGTLRLTAMMTSMVAVLYMMSTP